MDTCDQPHYFEQIGLTIKGMKIFQFKHDSELAHALKILFLAAKQHTFSFKCSLKQSLQTFQS
jgi:hypothetical protein